MGGIDWNLLVVKNNLDAFKNLKITVQEQIDILNELSRIPDIKYDYIKIVLHLCRKLISQINYCMKFEAESRNHPEKREEKFQHTKFINDAESMLNHLSRCAHCIVNENPHLRGRLTLNIFEVEQ